MIGLWTAAGFLLGWITIDIICCVSTKQQTPTAYKIAIGAVGALMAYTLVTGGIS